MKKLLFVIMCFSPIILTHAQVDSVAFAKSYDAKIKIEKSSEFKINKTTIKTVGIKTKFLSMDSDCNFVIPAYEELAQGQFNFRKIKSDVQASLSALGSSLSIERKFDFYVFYFTRYKLFSCVKNGKTIKTNYGVGAFVIFKVSKVKGKLKLKSPYDISAAAHLGLVRVELDVKTFGMKPSLQNKFIPEKLKDIDINAAKYFDDITKVVRTEISNSNTIPDFLPIEM